MRRLSVALVLSVAWTNAAHAQGRGGGDWMTSGGDAQRSAWVRSDPKITRERLSKPGFALAWKIKLANEPATAVTLDHYIGYRGFRALAFMGSSSGNIVAVDTDLGRIEWQKPLGTPARSSAAACAGGMTANVTRPGFAGFPAAPGRGGGGGRGNSAKGAVGQPDDGAPNLADLAARAAAAAARGPAPGRGPAPPSIFSPRVLTLDALSSDGTLHMMYVSSGEEPKQSIPFLPPSANARGLMIIDNVAYATTSQGCGGVANGLWALDLASKQVSSWKTGGDVAGSEGPAFGGDGTIYVATTDGELAALEPKTLNRKASYQSGGPGFTSSPVVFEYKDQVLIAAAAKDGSIYLLDAAALSGAPLAKTQPSSDLNPGSLASWQDASGVHWILAASKSKLVTWQLVEQNGSLTLQPGWVSREMVSPLAPIIVNGVVFAVSSGDRSTPAVLYAIDGELGKELWNSGKTIASFVRSGGFSASGSQVYLGTNDGTIYAFGFPIEH